ncbi:MAG: DivIVA domain-containing protein [Proteobacteria bacterium]|nr:DivIVA domain-containing protein [Pseudomonadota bacterium]
MKITAEDIHNQQFKIKFRGFDIREVDFFLEVVAAEFEELARQNVLLREKLSKSGALADQLKEKNTAEATETAPDVKRQKEESKSIIDKARATAEEIIKGAGVEAEALKDEIEHLKKTRSQLVTSLESLLATNTELLESWKKKTADEESPE